jgi:hypothetical protein
MPIVAFGWTVAVNTPYSSFHRSVEAGIYSRNWGDNFRY